MAPTIDLTLKRAAGEKRTQAMQKANDLKAFLLRQLDNKLAEGETRLSPQEISQKRQEIEDLNAEAKAIEGVDTLEGLITQPAGRGSAAAEEILRGRDGGERTASDLSAEARASKNFKDLGAFLRLVRATSGPSDLMNLPVPTKEQIGELALAWHRATLFTKGEPFATKYFNVNLGEETFALARKALVGDDTGSAGRGDYLVPTEPMAELLRVMAEQQQFASRARRIPMSRRTLSFPRLKQTDTADTRPLFSFAAVTKIAEGAEKAEREPTFEQLILTAIKYAAYVEASDELLLDSIVPLPPVLVDLLTSAIAYEFDRDTMRGGGTTEPQGFIGHASSWEQNRKTAATVGLEDLLGLEERFFGTGGIYLLHPSVIYSLGQLASGNVLYWSRDVSAAVPGTIMGRPMVRTHKLPARGTKGDICLVDPSFYLVGDLQAITVANSIHFKFRNDITAWRAIYRAAGTPWPAGMFSHEASGGKLVFRCSPFCVLDVVATS